MMDQRVSSGFFIRKIFWTRPVLTVSSPRCNTASTRLVLVLILLVPYYRGQVLKTENVDLCAPPSFHIIVAVSGKTDVFL